MSLNDILFSEEFLFEGEYFSTKRSRLRLLQTIKDTDRAMKSQLAFLKDSIPLFKIMIDGTNKFIIFGKTNDGKTYSTLDSNADDSTIRKISQFGEEYEKLKHKYFGDNADLKTMSKASQNMLKAIKKYKKDLQNEECSKEYEAFLNRCNKYLKELNELNKKLTEQINRIVSLQKKIESQDLIDEEKVMKILNNVERAASELVYWSGGISGHLKSYLGIPLN